jgi:hypothetical protein
MITTLSWMVTREPEEWRSRVGDQAAARFVLGGLLGGALGGVLVAVVAVAVTSTVTSSLPWFAAAAAIASLLYAGRDFGLWRIPRPQSRRQVPEAWRTIFSTQRASLAYAAVLGFGFLTRISSVAFYTLLLLGLGMGDSPFAVVALFALAGLARTSTVLLVPGFGLYEEMNAIKSLDRVGSGLLKVEGSLLLGTTSALVVWLLVRSAA